MRPFLFLALLLTLSCGEKKHQRVKYGKTTESMLIEMKGEPVKEEEIPLPSSKVLTFEQDEKYQIKDKKVVSAFKNPEGDEKMLLFWKHKFKDCSSQLKKIAAPKDSHTPPELELSCSQLGLSVIYSESSPFISRIHEYAKE